MSTAAPRPDGVASTVMTNLLDQHDWTNVTICDLDGASRTLIKGLPPKRLYLHPDDQIAALVQERETGERPKYDPIHEWVLPLRLAETWSLQSFASVFDALEPTADGREKRIMLAILHNDSTVVYYFMHEGMVKPRQN